jgi:hypothetical protein
MPSWSAFEWAGWIATVVGGIVALAAFAGWWRKAWAFLTMLWPAPPYPATPANVIEYAKGHVRPRAFIAEYATRRGLQTRPIHVEAAWLHERVTRLDFRTIRQLDRAVRKQRRRAYRLMDRCGFSGGVVDVGHLLGAVFDLVAYSHCGREGLQSHFDSLRFTSVSHQWIDDVAEVAET